MINGNETTTKWEQDNKIYIPKQVNYEDNKYTISGDEVTIITNNNCYTNYNTTYCDCYRYNEKYNILTEVYSCNRNPNSYIINNDYISENINDSVRIINDYTNYYIVMLLMIVVVLIFSLNMRKSGYKI